MDEQNTDETEVWCGRFLLGVAPVVSWVNYEAATEGVA